MRRLPTTATRWTAACSLAIAALIAARLTAAPSAAEVLMQGAVAALALFAGVKVWLHDCFESHLAAVVAAVATIGGVLLAITAGTPGRESTTITLVDAALLALGAAVLVLLEQDARLRRAGSAQVAVVVQQA